MDSSNTAEALRDKEHTPRQRLNVDSNESRERMERILREQLDLELFLKQKEINTISSNLRHGEALLKVLETAIKSLRLANTSPEDISDGYLAYLRRSADAFGHHQPARGSSGLLRERPRRTATALPKYTADTSSGTLFAQNSAGETVHVICPVCQRDQFVSVRGFLGHCRMQHGLEFASHDEAIHACGHNVYSDNDRTRTTASSRLTERMSKDRIPSNQTPNSHSLANMLDPIQLASFTDALEYIRRRKASDAGSSDSENDSDSQSTTMHTGHASKSATIAGSKPVSDGPQARESRFHVIRRVVLGNSSQYFAPQSRPPGEENSTHKWTVYIRSVSKEHPTAEYIRKVRVFLHPSYRPDDIVDLVPPDFALTRWGWGEFPVRLQVFFRDKRNKPVDLIHMLKLDDMWTGDTVPGAEKPIDFELDRRGLFTVPPLVEDHAFPPPPDNAILYKLLKHLCSIHPLVLTDALPHNRELSECPELILDMVPTSIVEKWTWGVAVSEDTWRNVWPIGKRLAAEESRNRALLALISRALSTPKDGPAAASEDAKQMLSDAVDAVLQACGSETDIFESFHRVISSSDISICSEALEALRVWRDSVSSTRRSISPDKDRGYFSKAFAWSLRQFLRQYRLVPLPVLSSNEQKACLHPSMLTQDIKGYGTDPDTEPAYGYATGQAVQEPPVHQSAGRERQPCQQDVFCNFCGVLSADTDMVHGSSNNENVPFYCSQYCTSMGAKEFSTLSGVSEALAKLPTGWDKSDDENDVDIMLTTSSHKASDLAAKSGSTGESSGDKSMPDIEKTASLIRAYHLGQQSERKLGGHSSEEEAGGQMVEDADSLGDTSNNADDDERDFGAGDRTIDWVWAAIRPLELTGAPASRFTESSSISDGKGDAGPESLVQLPNCNDEAFGEALEQRVVIGKLFVDVVKLFLRDIIAASDKTARMNRTECIHTNKTNVETGAAAVSRHRLLMLTPLHVLLAAKHNPQLFDVCANAFLGAEE